MAEDLTATPASDPSYELGSAQAPQRDIPDLNRLPSTASRASSPVPPADRAQAGAGHE